MNTDNAFIFYNIVPFCAGKEELLAQDVIELEEKTGIDLALYSLTLHPEGFPAARKAECMTESFRKFKAALKGSKVKPGILIQSILGHWPRTDKHEENWERTIDAEGNKVRFCPLDHGFRQYIFDTVVNLAKEQPCFIMGDDDIRSFSPNAECFCSLHTAEFNRRTGHSFTPEEYRKAVCECCIGDEIYNAFEQLRQDTVNGVCELIRKAIDSVAPEIPAGTCVPVWEIRFASAAARTIAAKGQKPVLRAATGDYMEKSSFDFCTNNLKTQAMRLFYKDIPAILDEADTFPHNRYSKSARSFHTKLCSAIFSGMNGAKIWYVNGHKNGFPIDRKYTEILAKYRNFDQVLAQTVVQTQPDGIIVPCHSNFLRWHPVTNARESFLPSKEWVTSFAGIYGIPFRPSFNLAENGIYAISGAESVQRFHDQELQQLLKGKLLLDGEAAVALTERGFGKYMGVHAEHKKFLYNGEHSVDKKINYPFSAHKDVPFLTVTNPNAKVFSTLYYAPSSCSPETEEVCPAVVFHKNELGGSICTTVFNSDVLCVWAHGERKSWFIDILDCLNEKPVPYVIVDDQWTMMLHRVIGDQQDVIGIFNLGYDPMDSLQLRCGRIPNNIEILTPQGKWEKLPFECSNYVLNIQSRLECYEMAALRLTYLEKQE